MCSRTARRQTSNVLEHLLRARRVEAAAVARDADLVAGARL
jgi:hypothetical protein